MLTFKMFQSASNFDLKSQKLIESANNIYKIIERSYKIACYFLISVYLKEFKKANLPQVLLERQVGA